MANTKLLEDLQRTTKEYVKKERDRLENEVEVLEKVLRGRTGGQGIQTSNAQAVAAVAQASLEEYLARK